MSNEPQPTGLNRGKNSNKDNHEQAQDGTYHSGELSSYVDSCITVATAIRWLTFALCLCSGSLLLLLTIYYLGNLKYAQERRKEIHKQCFQNASANDTEPCKNFEDDIWVVEPRFTTPTPTASPASSSGIVAFVYIANQPTPTASPASTPSPSPSPTSTPSPSPVPSPSPTPKTEKAEFAESKNQKTYEALRDLDSTMSVIQLPLINIQLLQTDLAPILVLLGLFFLYWLRLNLEFARNTLCNLYNDSSTANRVSRTIPAHFFILWPGSSRRRSHWIFWFILYSIVVSCLILIATDIHDFFGTGSRRAIALYKQAGWEAFKPYAYGKIVVEFLMAFVAAYVIYRLRSIIRDVRNLLTLVEWAPRAFHPLLYNLFAEEKSPLFEGANETSYDEYASRSFCLRIRLTFIGDRRNPNPHEEEYFEASVDLWESASHKNSYSETIDWKYLFSKSEWAHSSAEERRMRFFFFNVLTNPNIEKELSRKFWKVVEARKLQGEWVKKWEEKFGNDVLNDPNCEQKESKT